MSINSDAPGDVISIGSSDYEPELDDSAQSHQDGKPDSVHSKQVSALGRKRPRNDDDDSSFSDRSCNPDGYSPVVDSSPRHPKRARPRTSPGQRGSHQGSEEGELDESDDELNPRAALETGKTQESEVAAAAHPSTTITKKPSLPTSNELSSAGGSTELSEVDTLESSAGATMPAKPPTCIVGSLTLKLPALSPKKQGSWLARLKDWVQVLCQNNINSISDFTTEVARDAFMFYMDEHSGLRQAKKKAAKQTARYVETTRALQNVIESFKTSTNDIGSTSKIPVMNQATQQSEGSAEEGKISSNGASKNSSEKNQSLQQPGDVIVARQDVPTGGEELRQQKRYFPSATEPSSMCLLCGREGHKAMHCSKSKCRFCNSFDHWDFCCPTIQRRCDKCRQLGHQVADCTEKLALTKAEGLACAYCTSTEHLEGNCTEVWRSFHPDVDYVSPVTYLPCSCSVCGGHDHFSGDCSQRRGVSANPTWSLRNRDIYLDPKCGLLCIEDNTHNLDSKRPLRAPETKIRGHAARTANIVHFSESEESDVEFLGRRSVRDQKGGAGQIRMSSNIQLPQMMGSHKVNTFQPLAGQPPLPPGPPPSARHSRAYPPPPSTHGYSGQPPPPPPPAPPSLPAKPPASTRSYRNAPPPSHGNSEKHGRDSHRGRGGARGGRGGRGRGRGRGR